MKQTFDRASTALREGVKDSICYAIVYAVAMYGSLSLFNSILVPSGFDSVMHLSKISIFSNYFPTVPRWFPWWYCGTPSLRFYPPLSYLFATSLGGLFHLSALDAYKFTDFFAFFLAGLFMYLFMKTVTHSRLAGVSSAVLYMLSPQTLYGRFFVGHFTHNFSLFLIPLTFFCVVKYGNGAKKTALITAPLIALFFLTHYQTVLNFGLMLGIYIFCLFAVWRWKGKPKTARTRIKGLFLGGILGVALSAFWLLPSLVENSGQLGLTAEAALKTVVPIESLWYPAPLQNIWDKQYFLGFPMIFLFALAVVLIAKRKLGAEKMFWGTVFLLWTGLFLFAIVSPYAGIVIGWSNRMPYFVSMPMAMLGGLAVNWLEDHVLSSRLKGTSLRRLAKCLLLAIVLLASLLYASDLGQFAYYPYSDEIQVVEKLENLGLKTGERVASFGTLSYVFNVFSDGWQLDGGYVQGQVNLDFYYSYWLTLTAYDNVTAVDDLDAVLEMLNRTNTRYVIFPQVSFSPDSNTSVYQDRRFFERTDISGFTIYKLKDNYTLSLVEVTQGSASLSYDYVNPDALSLTIQDGSEDLTVIVKMNYYPGWVAHSDQGEVELSKNADGLMMVEISGTDACQITLEYTPVLLDQIALALTATGVLAYVLVFLKEFYRGPKGWNHTRHRGPKTWYATDLKGGRTKQQPSVSETGSSFEEKPSDSSLFAVNDMETETEAKTEEGKPLSRVYHFICLAVVASYALYISWPYLTAVGIPGFVDGPGHAFKVWYLTDCWSTYKVIPYFWDSWWYEGYPFLQVYPPLSYVTAAVFGAVFIGGDPLAGFRSAMVLSNVLASVFMYAGVYMLFRSRAGGIVASIVYASSAYRGAAVRTGMLPFYVGTMFLPLTIPLCQRVLSSRRTIDRVLLAGVMALLLLTHMQLFVYAVFTLGLFVFVRLMGRLRKAEIVGSLKASVKDLGATSLAILIGLGLAGFWLVPFLTYRGLFYTRYPEYYLELQSVGSPLLFLQRGGVYLGLSTLTVVVFAFVVNRKSWKNFFTIFFLVLTAFSGFLSIYQHSIFKGTFVEQMPYYNMITPDRWVFITFMSLAFLAGGATKLLCDSLNQLSIFSHKHAAKSVSKIVLTSIIACVIIADAGGSFVRGYYEVPTIQSFPAAVKNLSGTATYHRIYANIPGLAYVPAVTCEEIYAGWYVEGSVLRDWLYNLDWMTSYGERERIIPPLLELFAVKYYVTRADDFDRIARFNRTNEFTLSYEEDFCVIESKRESSYLQARHSILYLGKEEDLMTVAETLLFSSNSSILIRGWKEYVDDYTVEELSEFDAVLLYRYNSHTETGMENLLLQYAERGGTVLFAPFYAHQVLGMPMYVTQSAGQYNTDANPNFENTIFNNVNASEFSPAIYAGTYPWGYVAFNVTSAQRPTECLLTIDSNPALAVTPVGNGKIVWIGFNFLAHVNAFLNADEGRMLGNLLNWACGEPPIVEIVSFEKRPYGYVDVAFSVNATSSFWLLISETYYPGWRIYADHEAVSVYVAEPQLMMIKIEPETNSNICLSMRYEPTSAHLLGATVSAISVSLAVFMLFWRRK